MWKTDQKPENLNFTHILRFKMFDSHKPLYEKKENTKIGKFGVSKSYWSTDSWRGEKKPLNTYIVRYIY